MAEGSASDQEKTEEPTAKRLADARSKGQVPRSRELATAFVVLAGAGMLVGGGSVQAARLAGQWRRGLSLPREVLYSPDSMGLALGQAVVDALLTLAPILFATLVAAVAAPALLGGLLFSGSALRPDFSRLDPLRGFTRVFGAAGLVELGKALLKVLVVGSVAVAVAWQLVPDTLALGGLPVEVAIGRGAWLLAVALLLLSGGLLLVAAVDAPLEWWRHRRALRMSREEIREEMKETDGRPEVKSRIRQLQRQFARARMMADVPKADVVVMNPTHYAVALQYHPQSMRAPRVLAKGRDLVALEIRRIATQAGVAVVEAPPLARALHASTRLGAEVPPGLYLAVAQVLSYVFQVRELVRRHGAGAGSGLRAPNPAVDAALLPAVPEEEETLP